MFTKAIAKALVIVLTLGMTSLIASPLQAAVNADSLTVSSTNVTQYLGETETSSSPEVTLTFLGMNRGDTMSVQALYIFTPAMNTKMPTLKLIQSTNANLDTTTVLDGAVPLGYEFKASPPVAYVSPSANTVVVTAKFKMYLDAPTLAGTYSLRVFPSIVGGGGVASATFVDVLFTVVDPRVTRADSTISFPGDISNGGDAIINASKSMDSTNEVAVIRTTMKNAAGVTLLRDSYTAVITGSGVIGSAPLSNNINTSAVGRVITVKAGDAVTVYADGTAGVATIMILNSDGTVVATKSLTFVDLTNQASAILALSFSSFPEKGTPMQLTALVNLPGTVRFTSNGKTLGSCARVTATGLPKTAICQWKPPLAGSINVVARFTPTDSQISAVSTTKVLAIGRRSGKR
jgi:hypothetical protein